MSLTQPERDEHFTPTEYLTYLTSLHQWSLADLQVTPTVLLCFHTAFQEVASLLGATAHPRWHRQAYPAYIGDIAGERVSLLPLPLGAPAAVMLLEELIACGGRTFLVLGVAGALQPTLPIGSLVIPTSAIREEGTSFHYQPPGRPMRPAGRLVVALVEAARRRGLNPPLGSICTTDAFYRETRSKIAFYQQDGVLAIEMEAAALFAVAAYRQVELAHLLVISDELFHPWSPGFHTEALSQARRLAADIILDAIRHSKGEYSPST